MTKQLPATSPRVPRPIPPLLLISIPNALGEAPTLRAMAHAIGRVHIALRQSIETSIKAAETASGDDHDYWWGSIAAYSDSQDFLAKEICDQFDLHDQLDACEFPSDGPTHVEIPPLRPRLPSAAHVPIPNEVLDVLYAKRDHLASLAATFDAEARSWEADGSTDQHSLHRGMALAYAAACDLLEQALARITGLDLPAFTTFLDEHGTVRGLYQ